MKTYAVRLLLLLSVFVLGGCVIHPGVGYRVIIPVPAYHGYYTPGYSSGYWSGHSGYYWPTYSRGHGYRGHHSGRPHYQPARYPRR